MNIVLWVLQILLAIAFLAHGWLFLVPPAELVDQMNASLPRWFQIFIGVAEILAAIGLTLPGLTRVLPWLVTWAAGGIIVVTASATVYRLTRSEMSSAVTTLVLLTIALFVAYMRYRVVPSQGAVRLRTVSLRAARRHERDRKRVAVTPRCCLATARSAARQG